MFLFTTVVIKIVNTLPLHFCVFQFLKITLNKKTHFIVKYGVSKVECLAFQSVFLSPASLPWASSPPWAQCSQPWPQSELVCTGLCLQPEASFFFSFFFFFNKEDTVGISYVRTEQPPPVKCMFLCGKEGLQRSLMFGFFTVAQVFKILQTQQVSDPLAAPALDRGARPLGRGTLI